MTDKLNDNDKQRIEQEALDALWEKMSREDWLAGEGFSGKMGGLTKIPTVCKPRIFEFAKEYATLYERDKRKLWNDENNNLIKELGRRDGKIQQLEAERSELRNKVIEEAIQLLSLSSAAPFMPSQEEILNSLKTKP